jgi:hypothetical protein
MILSSISYILFWFLVPALSILAFPGFSADLYWVVFLKGNVVRTDSEKALKVGDKLPSDAKLRFSAKDAYAIVMGSKGKFTLRPEVNKSKPNEFVAFVNSALLPVKSTGRLSTRGEESGISDLGAYFGEDSFAFVGNQYAIRLDPKKYELSELKFIIYRYEFMGTVVSKKIAFEGSDLIIDEKALYTTPDGQTIDPASVSKKAELYKFDASTKSSSKITAFKPVFVDEEELQQQLVAVYNVCKEELNADEAKAEDELVKFVLDIYGRTDEIILKKWLKENILK